ncbi:MAG: hypothetical protein IJ602_03495 [Paludibacteraceae bacterium]|nr:hypothetical protein [Paludibacteraceae bacterium]
MKRFISAICIYLLAVLLIVLPPELYEIFTDADYGNAPGGEVRAAVRVSKTKTNKKIKKLILGDSTGHALYPSEKEYDDIVSMACNQAITFAGQYFLLKNYLETNKDNLPREIIFLLTPESFENDVDKYAYQYFLKPFPIREYKLLYTKHLYSRIKSIPLYWTANLPFIQTSGYTPRVAVPAFTERTSMSELTSEYLVLMDSITKEYRVPFELYATPVRDDRVEQIEKISLDLQNGNLYYLSHLLKPYIETINYYPSKLFLDPVHMNDNDTPKDYLGIL